MQGSRLVFLALEVGISSTLQQARCAALRCAAFCDRGHTGVSHGLVVRPSGRWAAALCDRRDVGVWAHRHAAVLGKCELSDGIVREPCECVMDCATYNDTHISAQMYAHACTHTRTHALIGTHPRHPHGHTLSRWIRYALFPGKDVYVVTKNRRCSPLPPLPLQRVCEG